MLTKNIINCSRYGLVHCLRSIMNQTKAPTYACGGAFLRDLPWRSTLRLLYGALTAHHPAISSRHKYQHHFYALVNCQNKREMRCWALFFATAKAVELTHIPPMPDIDQISTDEVA